MMSVAGGSSQLDSRASTVGAWIATCEPSPPPALHQRLQEMLAPWAAEPVSAVPDACLTAGESALNTLLASGSTSRATALDLLAVDALVTYAFQLAADDPTRIEARAAAAMARIAALPERSGT